MRDCIDYIELISARLDGELTPAEEAELDAHLAACPACRALAEDMAALHVELPKLAAEPPADLMENVMARIRAETPAPIPFPAEQVRKTPNRKWRAWGATAAVLAVAVFGAATLRMNGPSGGMSGGAPMLAVNENQAGQPSADCAPVPESSAVPAPDQGPVTFSAGGEEPSVSPAEQPESTVMPTAGETPQPSAEPRVAVRADLPPQEAENSPAESESGETSGDASGQGSVSIMTAIPPEEAAPTDGAETLTVMEAADRLYEEQFQSAWPDAERVDGEDFQGYILEPFHLIREEDPESGWTSFGVRFKGKGEGGNYYIFVLYHEYADEQAALERKTWELEYLGVPVSGDGDILTEPQNIELFDSQDAYDAARSSFWEEVNQGHKKVPPPFGRRPFCIWARAGGAAMTSHGPTG